MEDQKVADSIKGKALKDRVWKSLGSRRLRQFKC